MSGPIHLFGVCGASNTSGRGNATLSPPVTNGSLEWTGNNLIPLVDPVGDATDGSMWPSFANAYYDRSGVPVCIAPKTFGGTRMVPEGQAWSATGSPNRTLETCNFVLSAYDELEDDGWEPEIKGVIWCGGPDALNWGGTAAEFEAAYAPALLDFHARCETHLAQQTRVFIIQMGTIVGGTPQQVARFAAGRAAEATAGMGTRVHLVYDQAYTFPDQGWMLDSVHWNQFALNAAGTGAGNGVADVLITQPPTAVVLRGNGAIATLYSMRDGELVPVTLTRSA